MDTSNKSAAIVKAYSRAVLSENGKLTRELFESINAGNIAVIRTVLEEQKSRIMWRASQEQDPEKRGIEESAAGSVQEVIDNLPELFP